MWNVSRSEYMFINIMCSISSFSVFNSNKTELCPKLSWGSFGKQCIWENRKFGQMENLGDWNMWANIFKWKLGAIIEQIENLKKKMGKLTTLKLENVATSTAAAVVKWHLSRSDAIKVLNIQMFSGWFRQNLGKLTTLENVDNRTAAVVRWHLSCSAAMKIFNIQMFSGQCQ